MAQDGDGVLRCSGTSDLFVQRQYAHVSPPASTAATASDKRARPDVDGLGDGAEHHGREHTGHGVATGLPVVSCVTEQAPDIGGSTVDDRSPPIEAAIQDRITTRDLHRHNRDAVSARATWLEMPRGVWG